MQARSERHGAGTVREPTRSCFSALAFAAPMTTLPCNTATQGGRMAAAGPRYARRFMPLNAKISGVSAAGDET
jgi:hypothetical protein